MTTFFNCWKTLPVVETDPWGIRNNLVLSLLTVVVLQKSSSLCTYSLFSEPQKIKRTICSHCDAKPGCICMPLRPAPLEENSPICVTILTLRKKIKRTFFYNNNFIWKTASKSLKQVPCINQVVPRCKTICRKEQKVVTLVTWRPSPPCHIGCFLGQVNCWRRACLAWSS